MLTSFFHYTLVCSLSLSISSYTFPLRMVVLFMLRLFCQMYIKLAALVYRHTQTKTILSLNECQAAAGVLFYFNVDLYRYF